MACIKCGKDTTNNAEFCETCLAEMTYYPVRPGTPVILPKREEHSAARHSRKKTIKPEQQVAHLKKGMRWLLVICLLQLVLLAVAAVMIWLMWDETAITSLLT